MVGFLLPWIHSVESLFLVQFCCHVILTTSCCPRVVGAQLEQLRRLHFCPRHLRRRRARRYRLSPTRASVLAAMRPSPLQQVFPTKLLNENHPWPPASRALLWDRSSGVSSWWRIWQLFMKKMLSQAHQKHTLGGGKT